MSNNKDDSDDDFDYKKELEETRKSISHLVDFFKDEGFDISGCSFCVSRTPKYHPTKCPFCRRLVGLDGKTILEN